MIDKLDVFIWGIKAGTLVESKAGYQSKILFYFDPSFFTLDSTSRAI